MAKPSVTDNSTRLNSIQSLRGLASLGVCLLHVTGVAMFLPTQIISIAQMGWMGTPIFFVISGFIIPYVLYKNDYKLNDYKYYVLKRLIRLDPPYIFSIILMLLLDYIITIMGLNRGAPFSVDYFNLILHFGYLVDIFGYKWINPVAWTLAIEFQYYLLLGLIFPYLLQGRTKAWVISVTLFSLAFIIQTPHLVFKYVFLFFMGFSTFKFYAGLTDKYLLILSWVAGSIGIYFTFGISHVFPCLFAVGFILFFRYHNSYLEFLGNISYSLYLIHSLIGEKIVNFGKRFVQDEMSMLVVTFVALITTLVCAYFMYYFIEKPAQQWASKIKYK